MPDSFTKLLLHCNGIDGSTSFPDASDSAHTVTAHGDAQVDTAQKKFGTGSALFDGTGDYLSVPDHADWNFGTGDFTIDFWIRGATWGAVKRGFYDQYDDGINDFRFYYHSGGYIYLYVTVGGVEKANYSVAWSPSVDTWYHMALVRDGINVYLFIDGISQSLTVTTPISTNAMPDLSADPTIGYYVDGPGYVDGWMDEIRISKGIARWTANFTPPTEEYNGVIFVPQVIMI